MWKRFLSRLRSRFFLRCGAIFCGGLVVSLCLLSLPLSASADTIALNPTFSTSDYNLLTVDAASQSFTNILESQYTYGGTYNPLILACGTVHKWTRAIASVRWNFGRELPAGTEIAIQCAGWANKSYNPSVKAMSVALTSPTSQANYQTYLAERAVLSLIDDGYVQTSNGNYYGYLCSGTYTLPAKSTYVYLVWDIVVPSERNGGTYVGISCNGISFQGTPPSPLESDVSNAGVDDANSALDDYENAESALRDSGLMDVENALEGVKNSADALTTFVYPLQAVVLLFSHFTDHVPFVNILLQLSIGLGLFMILLGVAGEAYGVSRAAQDKARAEKLAKAEKRSVSVTRTKSTFDKKSGIRTTITSSRRKNL